MEHIGIDLGARKSDICIASETGAVLHRESVLTRELGRWLATRSDVVRVVMESCTQSRAVAQLAQQAGHDAWVVPSHVVRALGVGARGLKTDRRDAEALALCSSRNLELPVSWQRTEQAVARAQLCSARATLVRQRAMNINFVKSTMRARLWTAPSRNIKNFAQKVRDCFAREAESVTLALEIVLQTITHLDAQIATLDAELHELATHDEAIARLTAIPGVGVITACTFAAIIDDPHRFQRADELGSYLALVPGEASTGGKTKRTGVIHAGPLHLRSLLVQCAWSMLRTRPNDPLTRWALRVMERRGKKVGILALARKLAVIMWAMLRKARRYDPALAAMAVPDDHGVTQLVRALRETHVTSAPATAT